MKISAIETLQLETLPNHVWVQVHTDEGLVGLGETCKSAQAVVGHIHQIAAPYLLGKDALQIERHSAFLFQPICGFSSTGAEIRAASALDVALWDLFGKRYGMPVWQALGGRSHDRVRVYNTCASNDYNAFSTWRRELSGKESHDGSGRYDDLTAWNYRAGELAEDLLEEGYTAMKIWPFDRFATAGGNTFITAQDLRSGVEPFEKIRKTVGERMEILCEMHSLWTLPAAIRIGQAIRPSRCRRWAAGRARRWCGAMRISPRIISRLSPRRCASRWPLCRKLWAQIGHSREIKRARIAASP